MSHGISTNSSSLQTKVSSWSFFLQWILGLCVLLLNSPKSISSRYIPWDFLPYWIYVQWSCWRNKRREKATEQRNSVTVCCIALHSYIRAIGTDVTGGVLHACIYIMMGMVDRQDCYNLLEIVLHHNFCVRFFQACLGTPNNMIANHRLMICNHSLFLQPFMKKKHAWY